MFRQAFGWAAMVLAVLVTGCSTMQVATDHNPQADFSALKTYRWVEPPDAPPPDPRIRNDLLEKRIQAIADALLQARGYRRVEEGPVDFLLSWYATLDEKLDVQVVNNYYGYAPGWGWRGRYYPYGGMGQETYISRYDEGTLILDVMDADTRELIRRGYAVDRVNLTAKPETKDEQLREAIGRMLADFPPGTGKPEKK
jgi:hypothetical protein